MAEPLIEGLVAYGAEITYLLMLDAKTMRPVQRGEFPHCAMWNAIPYRSQCAAEIVITDKDGDFDDRCTREAGHLGSHVSHESPGLPTLAWLEVGSEPSSSTPGRAE